ncbi:uncharacterized protein FOMMEDRAFT_152279 [Fomitiporia mediterranea MF3/22]|uniref:uncharacterized protein n=1 Tax=Fomitiporia mediterranea (strain MF3/22) TaxID=694068 RepID=UPI0004407582|nr:uncharacterized protein FOMMEDRAFT_152279 [Fomitiporia mediterranea MF3/22]EJD06941.1 hypothetical protein FOMMEDRAFT_152279 [Fomitiporia mediterranea MF3/22]
MKSTSEYSPLAVSDETEESVFSVSSDDDQHNSDLSFENPTLRRLLGLTVVLSLVCSIVSLVFLCMNARTQWDLHFLLGGIVVQSSTPDERPDPGLLERPSVYNVLDKLPPELQHSALLGTLDVFPSFFQPVDHIHRHYVFPSDGHARFTFNGRVSPGDHRILLTDHITMIAQFRVHDYGMERCRVVSSIPSWELLQSHNQTLHLAGDTSHIEVWNLTSSGKALDERTLAWETKPPRRELITTLSVHENSTHKSDEFWCGTSGSLQTFELLCPGVGCYIELWQDYYFQPRFGIIIQQFPSK